MGLHGRKPIFIFLHFLPLLLLHTASSYPHPLNCTETTRLCTSFLAFKPTSDQTLPSIQSMFDVLQNDITVEPDDGRGYVFVRKNCSCAMGLNKYLTNTTFTVTETNYNGSVYDLAKDSYHDLVYVQTNRTRVARKGAVVSLKLMCGCSSGLWNYLMSYVMRAGDSVESLASRFGVSMDSIESVNGISNPDNVTVGELYFIPLNSVPGEPYPVNNGTTAAPAPAPSEDNVVAKEVNHGSHTPYWWIIGILAGGLAVVILVVVLFMFSRSKGCFSRPQRNQGNATNGKISLLRNTSYCCASGRSLSGDSKQYNGESSNRHMNVPSVIGSDIFDIEKPVIFTYEEVSVSTDGFSDSNLVGHGTYGSMYHGHLRNQEVAIKKMTATKTKEFMAEMKVLCKVHHANLVELIGYAASIDELFLIYEFAHMGSLRNHLHNPQNKGHTPLSWIMRVQIALDAARGLEYIHEHTRPHYVHRDIKTSNILLDSSLRAKISDFGLAKLVMATNEEQSVTRVVGTYGYLAPEYLRDGIATSKSDVFAFGVVLFEMISGKEAMTRGVERRSLASIMLAAMRNTPDFMSLSSLKDHIDPNLMDLYPHDCLFKVATLAKQCVDDDPSLRPEMNQVVISLSQILLSSVEWEATLAGNSQVFSGLVQGR